MSMDVTRLPSGLVVVTDAMPHLQSASLGVWVGSGSRDETPTRMESRISSNTWRSRDHAPHRRQIAEESKRSAAISTRRPAWESTAYYARCCARRAARARRTLRHPHQSDVRAGGAGTREECHRAGDRRQRRHARRPDLRISAGRRLPGSAGRPLDPRHARNGALVRQPQTARLPRAQLSRARHGDRGGGRGRSQGNRRRGRAALLLIQRP